ncbi:YppG family protein [Bacillaceae bacterium W0354]
MFPGRPPRPPFPPPFKAPRPPMPYSGPPSQKQTNLLSLFQDENGQLDIDKVMGTAQQVGKIYGQVSPLLSKLKK